MTAVLSPATPQEAAATLAEASRERATVTVVGGGTRCAPRPPDPAADRDCARPASGPWWPTSRPTSR